MSDRDAALDRLHDLLAPNPDAVTTGRVQATGRHGLARLLQSRIEHFVKVIDPTDPVAWQLIEPAIQMQRHIAAIEAQFPHPERIWLRDDKDAPPASEPLKVARASLVGPLNELLIKLDQVQAHLLFADRWETDARGVVRQQFLKAVWKVTAAGGDVDSVLADVALVLGVPDAG